MSEAEEPRGQRKKATVRKEEIIGIAAEMFALRGYNGTSLRDIADRAGLTKAALYYHFPDKEQIFEVVVMTRLAALIADATEAAEGAGDQPLKKIEAVLVASAGRIDRDRSGWVASSNAFWSIENTQNRTRIVEMRDQYEKILRDAIRDAMAQGLIREDDAGLIGRLLLTGLNGIARWRNESGPLSVVDIIRRYLDFVFAGVLTEEGRARR